MAESTLPDASEGGFQLYYKEPKGNGINVALHSGVRIGDLVLPYSLGVAGVALGFSVMKNMELKEQLDKSKKSLSSARKKASGYSSSRRAKKGGARKFNKP